MKNIEECILCTNYEEKRCKYPHTPCNDEQHDQTLPTPELGDKEIPLKPEPPM